jgi:hypothetical protein
LAAEPVIRGGAIDAAADDGDIEYGLFQALP